MMMYKIMFLAIALLNLLGFALVISADDTKKSCNNTPLDNAELKEAM